MKVSKRQIGYVNNIEFHCNKNISNYPDTNDTNDINENCQVSSDLALDEIV